MLFVKKGGSDSLYVGQEQILTEKEQKGLSWEKVGNFGEMEERWSEEGVEVKKENSWCGGKGIFDSIIASIKMFRLKIIKIKI